MDKRKVFWDYFNQKEFDKAQSALDQMDDQDKQKILAQLFQQSQCQRIPHSVSVLYRNLHENKSFSDFYEEWFPPKEKCNKQLIDGELYHQFFTVPIRVLNAVNINDPNEIVSIGLHWMTDKELEHALNDSKTASDSAGRGEKIEKVAERAKTGIYKVLKDDNLGTAF